MASSRKPRPTPDDRPAGERRLLESLREAVEAAVATAVPPGGEATLASPVRRQRTPPPAPLLIAFSGGRDSTALLHACCTLRAARLRAFKELRAVHVHHGLQAGADDWARHCAALGGRVGVPVEVRRVQVLRQGRGIEAAARAARYAALAEAAVAQRAAAVLTAHHLDDRIETFLLQWLRGAGVDGLAAFPGVRAFADGTVKLVRPFSAVARRDLAEYVERHGLPVVEDPSNQDTRLARNAVRQRVLPVLAELRPGYERAAARSVELVAEAAQVLREVAAADLHACSAGASGASRAALRLDRLQTLSSARQALVLRQWLAQFGIEAPPRARLGEIVAQALHARSDARMLVRIGASEVRRHRGLLLLRTVDTAREREGQRLLWQGERAIEVPSWRGRLHFVEVEQGEGFDPAWLRAAPLELRGRGGGERFKPQAGRPSRTLKRLFQDAGVPEFERGHLPLVWRQDRLIYVAGLGADVRLTDSDGARVQLRWQPASDLIQAD
ncbi:MAG: tRNA lysidine(34) synthetase TilS [Betaproteobacteria bacterium]